MKPQRFRSLRERSCITAVLFFACASVSAALFSPACFADQIDDMKKFKEECGNETGDSIEIYTDRSRDKLVEAYDPDVQCKENSGDESPALSHNALQVSRDVWGKRPSFIVHGHNEAESRKIGACRTVYNTIKDIYNHSQLRNSDYCTSIKKDLDAAIECGGVEKRCEPQYRRVKDVLKSYTSIKEDILKAQRYLEITVKSSEEARAKYEKDLEHFVVELNKRSAQAGDPLEKLSSFPDRPDLKPTNGNTRSKTLADYFKLLTTADYKLNIPLRSQTGQFAGKLITEHRVAGRQALEFMRKITTQTAKQALFAESMVPRFETMLAGIDKSGSVKPGPFANLGTMAPAATGALGLGSQVLGNNSPAPAQLTGLSSGSSAPSLATLAAAGAAGAALHSRFGASSASTGSDPAADPIGQQAPAKPMAPPETTKFGDDAPTAKAGSPANDLPVATNKNDAAKTEATPAGGNYPAFGASDGSSRNLAGAKKMTRAAPPAEAKPGSSAGEDTFNSFGGNGMAPKPAPKGAQVSAGAEVANLLGQMKNLFNFDEGSPMGGPAQNSSGVPIDPALAPPTAEGEQVALGDTAPAPEGEVAAAETTPEEKVQASTFGRSDTSLFSRVHKRHTRCMERGLVLYQLGERVE